MIPLVGYGLIVAGTLLVTSISGCSKNNKEAVKETKSDKKSITLQGPIPPICKAGITSFLWNNNDIFSLDRSEDVISFCKNILKKQCGLALKLFACIPNPPSTVEEKLDTIAIFSLLLATKANQPAGFYESNKDFIDTVLFNVANGKVKVRETSENEKRYVFKKEMAAYYNSGDNTLHVLQSDLLSTRLDQSIALHELHHSWSDSKRNRESHLLSEFYAYVKQAEYLLSAEELQSEESANKFISELEKENKSHPLIFAYRAVYDRLHWNPRRAFEEEKLRDSLSQLFYRDLMISTVELASDFTKENLTKLRSVVDDPSKAIELFTVVMKPQLQIENRKTLAQIEEKSCSPSILQNNNDKNFEQRLRVFFTRILMEVFSQRTLEFYIKNPKKWVESSNDFTIVDFDFDDPLLQSLLAKSILLNPKFKQWKGRLEDCIEAGNDGTN